MQLKQFLELAPEGIHVYTEYVICIEKQMQIPFSCDAAQKEVVIVPDGVRMVPSGGSNAFLAMSDLFPRRRGGRSAAALCPLVIEYR